MELPVRITLQEPLTVGSDTLTELVFSRRPAVKDLYGVKDVGHDAEDTIKIASRFCGVNRGILGNLSIADYLQVLKVVGDFLSPGRETGSE